MAHYYHMCHEMDEAREIREAYNENNTGDKGTFEDPSELVELPTAAGSVMLDLGEISSGGGLGGDRPRRPLQQRPQTSSLPGRGSTIGGTNANSTKGGAKRKMRRRGSDGAVESSKDGGSGSTSVRKGGQVQFDVNGNAIATGNLSSSLFNKSSDEDDVPPLTAEVRRARPRRCSAVAHATA